jgi:hypothetical protein
VGTGQSQDTTLTVTGGSSCVIESLFEIFIL